MWRPAATNALAALILLVSSTQLGLHFWPDSSIIHGIRVDYLSPTFYLLDLLIILFFVVTKFKNLPIWNWRIILPLLLTNFLFSVNPLATLTWSLRVLLYALFITAIPPRLLKPSAYLLIGAMAFQLILGAFQVSFGHSLQGIFYYFGERYLSVGSPAVATGSFMGRVLLRAYGTFSHPNVLAGWLVACVLIISHLTKSRVTMSLITLLAAVGVFLTQSRSAALSLFVVVIPFYLLRSRRPLYFGVLLITVYCLLFTGALSRDLELSLGERLTLQRVSFSLLQNSPLFGSGANASIATYPSISKSLRPLQPDHNSFTLLLSWFGLVGLVVLFSPLKPNLRLLKSIIPLLPLLLLDHYLLTSPQGLFILLLYLRLHWSSNATHRRL